MRTIFNVLTPITVFIIAYKSIVQALWNFRYRHRLNDNMGKVETVILFIICSLMGRKTSLAVTCCCAYGLMIAGLGLLVYLKKQNKKVYGNEPEIKECYDEEIRKNEKILAISAAVITVMTLICKAYV